MVKSLHEKNKELEEKLEETIDRNNRDRERYTIGLEKKNVKIENLRMQIDAIEQNLKNRDVRITGLPEADEDKNITQTVLNIANNHLRLNLESSDIEKIHRMGRVNKKPRDIILTFSTQEARDKFYNNRKKSPKRGSLSQMSGISAFPMFLLRLGHGILYTLLR